MSIKRIYFNNVGEAGQEPQFIYIETTDTLAQVTTIGYLNKAVANKLPISDKLMAIVTMKTSPSATATQTKLFSIVNSGKNWSLTAPPGEVKLFAQQTTAGGSSVETYAISNIQNGDLAFVQMVDNGTNNVTILSALTFAGFLQITFSADPGADCIFNYQILQ